MPSLRKYSSLAAMSSATIFNMKYLIAIFLLTVNTLYAQVKNKNEFILKGKVNYQSNRFIYFVWYNANEERFLDSTKVINGTFYYRGISNGYLDRFYVKTNPQEKSNNDYQNNVRMPIDNSVMQLTLKLGQFSKYKLIGCKSCDLLAEKTKNNNQQESEIIKWCINNPDNNITPLEILNYIDHNESTAIGTYYIGLSEFQKNSFYGQKIKIKISHNIFLTTLIGSTAPSFEKIGYDSTSVNLDIINKNNYVLLDFWGSWCAPCRASHPALIKLYKKYHSSNFNIVGIASDDENIASWKKAITQDSIYIWPNILTGYSTQSNAKSKSLSELYYVKIFPTKILVDINGKIIGRYSGDNFEELEKQLKAIYGY